MCAADALFQKQRDGVDVAVETTSQPFEVVYRKESTKTTKAKNNEDVTLNSLRRRDMRMTIHRQQ